MAISPHSSKTTGHHHRHLNAATDDDQEARTLKERFGTAYEHARKVARELEVACKKYEHRQVQPVKQNIW